MRSSCAEVFGLSPAQVDELMIDIWDWYCGELDEELVSYVRGLRPRLKTGIVSNSADGARREETRRYAFPTSSTTSSTPTTLGLPSRTRRSTRWPAKDWASERPKPRSSTTFQPTWPARLVLAYKRSCTSRPQRLSGR